MLCKDISTIFARVDDQECVPLTIQKSRRIRLQQNLRRWWIFATLQGYYKDRKENFDSALQTKCITTLHIHLLYRFRTPTHLNSAILLILTIFVLVELQKRFLRLLL